MERGKERGKRKGGAKYSCQKEDLFMLSTQRDMPLLEIQFKYGSCWDTEMLCNRSK